MKPAVHFVIAVRSAITFLSYVLTLVLIIAVLWTTVAADWTTLWQEDHKFRAEVHGVHPWVAMIITD